MIRKIVSREEREKKEKRNKIVIGLILVGIMVLSTAGFAFFQIRGGTRNEIDKIEYKGIKFFLLEDNLWHFFVDNEEFAVFFNPQEIENISISTTSLSLGNFFGKRVYFSYESDREGINEISRNLGRFFKGMQLACLEKCEEDLPLKNCSDNIIIIKEANESLIKQEENCVYVLGKKEELVKMSDGFIFKFLGI